MGPGPFRGRLGVLVGYRIGKGGRACTLPGLWPGCQCVLSDRFVQEVWPVGCVVRVSGIR